LSGAVLTGAVRAGPAVLAGVAVLAVGLRRCVGAETPSPGTTGTAGVLDLAQRAGRLRPARPIGITRPGGTGGQVGAVRGAHRIDDHSEVDRGTQMPAQRLADRAAEIALDRVLRELRRGGQQSGAVQQTEGPGQTEERALLRGHAHTRARLGARGAGQLDDDLLPDLAQTVGLVSHPRSLPLVISTMVDTDPDVVHRVIHTCARERTRRRSHPTELPRQAGERSPGRTT